MTERSENIVAASVRQRLLNLRETQGGEYNPLLTQYAIERFLSRLSKSELTERFVSIRGRSRQTCHLAGQRWNTDADRRGIR